MVMSNLVDGAKSMSEKPKKKWMKKAVPENHKGIFTAKAKAAGKSVHEYAEEEKNAPGWLDRILKENDKEVAKWPKWKKEIAKREMLRNYGDNLHE